MNEQDIKKMVESILTDLVDQQGNTAVAINNVSESANDKACENVDANCSIPDITEVDLRKQLLVTEPN
ncbi:ethanolamine ammonia-lyase, partial [Enterococcus sp. S181_ASV_20]|nr:ethanolamine ammonia-lyase [Enterococcus sp. S181_ASV_20]